MRGENNASEVEVVEDSFGFYREEGKPAELIRRFTMTNHNRMTVQIITYGAAITSVSVPDRHGNVSDVVLGFDDLDGYLSLKGENPYMGAVIGRVTNRTGNGRFEIGGRTYQLKQNVGEHHLHGGFKGFDKMIWESHVAGNKVTMTYLSKDEEEGYPGEVMAHATYQLTPDNQVILEFKATTTKPTPINLTNHTYFNLAGHEAGANGLYNHIMSINADRYTPLNDQMIVTGEIKSVGGTLYDLRIPRAVGDIINLLPGGGFDINYCVNGGEADSRRFVSRVHHRDTGRVLEVHSDQPGVQFYSANFFPTDDSINGKNGVHYKKHGGFALEAQNYPNAVNVSTFPNSILLPGDVYSCNIVYRFSTIEPC